MGCKTQHDCSQCLRNARCTLCWVVQSRVDLRKLRRGCRHLISVPPAVASKEPPGRNAVASTGAHAPASLYTAQFASRFSNGPLIQIKSISQKTLRIQAHQSGKCSGLTSQKVGAWSTTETITLSRYHALPRAVGISLSLHLLQNGGKMQCTSDRMHLVLLVVSTELLGETLVIRSANWKT